MNYRYWIVLSAAWMLVACAVPVERKQAKVEWQRHDYSVFFNSKATTLSPYEISDFTAFLKDIPVMATQEIEIMRHPAMPRASSRTEAVEALLAEHGFARAPTSLATSTKLDRDEMVIIVGVASVAALPCPDWSQSAIANFRNDLHSNMGCATAQNLGAMVANPADLVEGHGTLAPDADHDSNPIRRYRGEAVQAVPGAASATGASPTAGAASSGK